jgi:hypothetical protein
MQAVIVRLHHDACDAPALTDIQRWTQGVNQLELLAVVRWRAAHG